MQLQLRVIAFESFHLDNGGLLKIRETELFTLDLLHGLHDFSQGVYDVNQIVALIVNCVNKLASVSETTLKASLEHVFHQIWMRLVANLEHIVLVHKAETSRCGLQIIESVSHVTIGSKD